MQGGGRLTRRSGGWILRRTAAYFAFAALACLAAASAQADPLVYLYLQGRASGTNDPFTNSVTVVPGQTVDYRVVGQLAPIGASNTNGHARQTHTITSLTANTGVQAGDGIQAIMLDLFQLPTDPVQLDLAVATLSPDPTPMPNDSWDGWPGYSSRGTPTSRGGGPSGSHDLDSVFAIHSPGVRTGVSAEVLFWGTFTTGLDSPLGASSLLRMRWGSAPGAQGSIAINGHPSMNDIIHISTLTESKTDPIVAIDSPLFGSSPGDAFDSTQTYQLRVNVVPEPATSSLFGLALASFILRRHHGRPSQVSIL